jgi:PAS domain S-box-containing protein
MSFRPLIQAAPMAVVAVDHDANITTWNSAAEKMFG